MEFKIISHTYENTGGHTMVGFDEVWLPEEDRTIFVRTSEIGCSFWTVDAYVGDLDNIDAFDWVDLEFPSNGSGKYVDVAKECLRRYAMDDGGLSMPIDMLPDTARRQITAHYQKWLNEHGEWPTLSNDGCNLVKSIDYEDPKNVVLDAQTYYAVSSSLFRIKDAFTDLNRVWEKHDVALILDDSEIYPFEYSFDEMTSKVIEWAWDLIRKIDDGHSH